MGFVVLPASIPDIREIYDVYFCAFDGELVTQILFPWDTHNKEFREGHTKHTLDYWHKDSLQYTYKCIDTNTGKIVGMSLWDFHWKPRSEEARKLPAVDWLHGDQQKRAQDFIRAFWQRKEDLVAGKKHVYCHVVAVLPEYQRCGIGASLMQPGINIAHQMDVPVYLEATGQAVRLYERLGFEKLKQGVLLSADTVGKSEPAEAPIMVRMPSGGVAFETWVKRIED